MICVNEENEIEEENVSPMPHFSIIKLILTIAIEKASLQGTLTWRMLFATQQWNGMCSSSYPGS